MKPILVPCALIFRDGKILAVKRSLSMTQGGLWEFAGGKLEKGESPENCLKREISEELNIDISILMALTQTEFSYRVDKIIRLMPFLCRWKSGQILLAEHEEFQWLEQQDLKDLNWAPADLPVVQELDRFWIPIQRILEKDLPNHSHVS